MKIEVRCMPFGYHGKTAMRDQRPVVGTEKFTYQPFDPIARYRITNFSADSQAKTAWSRRLILFDKNKKMGRMYLAPHLLTLQELLPFFKSVCCGKGLPALNHLQLRYLLEIVAARFLRPLARRRRTTD